MEDKNNKYCSIVYGKYGGMHSKKYSVTESCHAGTKKVFTINHNGNDIAFYGGGKSNGLVMYKDSIFLDLTGNDDNYSSLFSTSKLFTDLASKYTDIHQLKLEWDDYGTPDIKDGFWSDFLDIVKQSGKDTVVVACQGGHGRTGTALSILYGLSFPDVSNPVEKIRELYCRNAVESNSQVEYIKQVLGIEFRVPFIESIFYGGMMSESSSYDDYFLKWEQERAQNNKRMLDCLDKESAEDKEIWDSMPDEIDTEVGTYYKGTDIHGSKCFLCDNCTTVLYPEEIQYYINGNKK